MEDVDISTCYATPNRSTKNDLEETYPQYSVAKGSEEEGQENDNELLYYKIPIISNSIRIINEVVKVYLLNRKPKV